MNPKINNTICKIFNIRKSKDVIVFDVILTIITFLLSVKMMTIYALSLIISMISIFLGIVILHIPRNASFEAYIPALFVGLKIMILLGVVIYILIKIFTIKIATCPLQEDEKL